LLLRLLLSCRVLYAPLGFFLQNPVGEMLVAFTKDQDIIDENLMDNLHYLGIYGLIMLSTVITVSVVVPYFAAFGAVLVLVTIVMLRFYLPAATALKKQKVETAGECDTQHLQRPCRQLPAAALSTHELQHACRTCLPLMCPAGMQASTLLAGAMLHVQHMCEIL
jgi:ABC-type multidrug transport system fused ATPase/permease subunit